MFNLVWNDLAAFGLPLAPGESLPGLTPLPRIRALLTNNTGEAVIGLTQLWKWTYADGRRGSCTLTPLATGHGVDLMTGRTSLDWSDPGIIAPGSRRLITPEAVYGDNSDVMTLPPPAPPSGDCHISWPAGGLPPDTSGISRVHFQIDSVFLASGVCIGPDEAGAFASLTSGFEPLRQLARELKRDLISGASRSAIIEKFRRRAHPAPPLDPSFVCDRLPRMFAGMAIHRLGHQPTGELIAWAESFDAPPGLNLRKA